jgi:hypothetical protein
MDPAKLKAAIEAIKNNDGDAALAVLEGMLVGEGGEEAPPEALGETPETPPPAAGEEQQSVLARIEKTMAGMNETIVKLSAQVKAYESTEATRESEERVELVAGLVKLCGEAPATAWSGKPEDRKPAEPWASMPIAALRDRVKRLSKNAPRRPAPPEAIDGGDDVAQLSKAEQAAADKITDPAAKQRFINLRLSRKGPPANG